MADHEQLSGGYPISPLKELLHSMVCGKPSRDEPVVSRAEPRRLRYVRRIWVGIVVALKLRERHPLIMTLRVEAVTTSTSQRLGSAARGDRPKHDVRWREGALRKVGHWHPIGTAGVQTCPVASR